MNIEEAKKIVSYGVGFQIANQLKEDDNLVTDIVLDTIQKVLKGEAKAPNQEEFTQAAKLIQEEQTKEQRAEGDTFLTANKDKDGVKVTESGLQYIVEQEGEGDSPEASDSVTVHYTGTLIDGTVFDSSVERGSPAQFGVSQVISGWVEGLQLMKPGAKYKFFIPQDLAYGEQGSPGSIPPFSALIFEVELIKVN